MVLLADDVILGIATCILTVGAACLSRSSAAKENERELHNLIKDAQRICCMYILEREGLSEEQREELRQTIVSVGIEFAPLVKELEGAAGEELKELVARGERQTKLESELKANLDKT